MGRPLQITADTIWNAGTVTTGFGGGGGANLVSRTLPSFLGGATQNCVTMAGTATNQTLFITTPAPGSTANVNGLSFWAYVDLTALADKTAGVGDGCNVKFQTSGAVDQFQAEITLRHGWNYIQLHKNDFSVLSGSPSWKTSTWVDVQIRLSGVAGVTHSVSIINLAWIGQSGASPVVWIADDGYTECTAMQDILDLYGFKLTIPIISSLVGTSGKMTVSQLQALHDRGCAIINHTDTHGAQPFMLSYTQNQAQTEIQNCKTFMETNGWTRDNENLDYVAPYGECTANILAACRAVGMRSYRGLFGQNFTTPAQPSWGIRGGIDDWPTPCESIVNTTTLAQMKAVAAKAIWAGRPIVVLAHKMVASPSLSIEVSTANITALAAYLYSLSAFTTPMTYPQLMTALQDPTR